MANVWTPAGTAGTKHEVDPISRIEGHLGVKVSVDGSGKIVDANAHGNLWRGFENFLLGREVNDAITFVQRICGVCPVPHGLTSTYAVDTVLGYSRGHISFATATETDGSTWGVPKKALLIRNLVAAVDTIMSTITHFYHLAAPSYIQGPAIPPWTPYFDNNYYHAVLLNSGNKAVPDLTTPHLWDAVIYSYVKALRIRRLTFEAGALFAGRMPMTSCFVGGGVTNDGTEDLTARIAKFKSIMTEVGMFIVSEYIPIALALGALYPDFDSQTNTLGTAGHPKGSGAGLGRFLAWGGFPNLDDTLTSVGGVFDTNDTAPGSEDVTHFRVSNKAEVYSKFLKDGTFSVPANLTEDIVNSRYSVATADATAYTGTKAYPGDVSRTKPNRASGYTYIKAPRWNGKACEVGPLARLVVAGIYPTDGSTLASKIPGYVSIYTNAGALDTRVIESTIVAGLSADALVPTVAGFILGLKGGLSTLDRLRARAIEALVLIQAVLGAATKSTAGVVSFSGGGWVDQLQAITGAGLWYADRRAPAGFAKSMFDGSLRIKLSIAAADFQANEFQNTQGLRYDVATTTSASADVYIPSDWNVGTGTRRADFWTFAVDGSKALTGFPIISFVNGTGFRVWDNLGWHDIGYPTGFTYGKWYTLKIKVNVGAAGSTTYYINGTQVYESLFTVDTDMATAVGINTIALQGHNYGSSYDIYFDNAGAQNTDQPGSTWAPHRPQFSLGTVQGWGGNEAARGALMHQTTIKNGRITKYQCIVPTTWNGSPKAGVSAERGAIEEAMIGANFYLSTGAPAVKGGATFTKQNNTSFTTEAGVEVLRIAQSFDPCIACAIH